MRVCSLPVPKKERWWERQNSISPRMKNETACKVMSREHCFVAAVSNKKAELYYLVFLLWNWQKYTVIMLVFLFPISDFVFFIDDHFIVLDHFWKVFCVIMDYFEVKRQSWDCESKTKEENVSPQPVNDFLP